MTHRPATTILVDDAVYFRNGSAARRCGEPDDLAFRRIRELVAGAGRR